MSQIAVQPPAGEWRVVFDGQSHNLVPGIGNIWVDGPGFPYYVMEDRGIPYTIVAIGGYSWTALAPSVSTRLYPTVSGAEKTVLVMNGGSHDVIDGDSGATVYADMVSYASGARAAGFSHILACTIPPMAALGEPRETNRQTANSLIISDPSGAFDEVADIASAPGVENPYSVAYWIDGIHWLRLGAINAAAVASAKLDLILAT